MLQRIIAILRAARLMTRRSDPSSAAIAPLFAPALDLALIVGAQRSGTSWLSYLVAAHPLIAAGPESHLFSHFLHHTWHRWWSEEQFIEKAGGLQGLACYLTQPEFESLLRHFSQAVLLKIQQAKPAARIVLEKTPEHAMSLDLVRTLFPSAKVVHMVRDPRDVIASQLAAAQHDWGDGWAPASAPDAARAWVKCIEAASKDASANPSLHLRIRYEDLLKSPQVLAQVYTFLNAPLPDEEVRRIYDQFSFENCAKGNAPPVLLTPGQRRKSTDPEKVIPKGFFRQGKTGGGQSLSPEQLQEIDPILRPWLNELNYPAPLPATAAP